MLMLMLCHVDDGIIWQLLLLMLNALSSVWTTAVADHAMSSCSLWRHYLAAVAADVECIIISLNYCCCWSCYVVIFIMTSLSSSCCCWCWMHYHLFELLLLLIMLCRHVHYDII
jgi:hypothetical protein